MELLQLRYFKKVAETGKISTAARELYISAPALSATISRLEKELGMQLFDRQANRIVLNAQGEIFLRHVNRVFASLDSARAEMQESLSRQGGEVRIAVTDAILWRELLSFFTDAHPEIRISATTVSLSRVKDLSLSGRYTFLLAAEGEAEREDWQCQTLFEDALMVMLNKKHPLAQEDGLYLEALRGEKAFLPPADAAFGQRLRSLVSEGDLRYNECADTVRYTMVQDGRGISFTTRYTDPDEGALVAYLPVKDAGCRWKVQMLYDAQRTLRSEEKVFLQFALDFFRKHRHTAENLKK